MSATQDLRAATTGKSVSPANQFQQYINLHRKQIEIALPSHLNADRMCRLALTAFHQNKTLSECEPKSIFASVVIASQMGLEIGVLGQGFLVPYRKKNVLHCQFIPGWKGLVDLVNRAGRSVVWTGAVYQGDSFDFALGDSPYVKHMPAGEDDPNKLLFTYSIGRVKGSEWPVIEVWPIKKLKAHFKKYNKVGAAHYAFENWEAYCRKIPLLRVIDFMPKSIEVQRALEVDAALEAGKSATIDGDFVNVTDDEEPPESGAPKKGADADAGSNAGQDAAKDNPKKLQVVDTDGVELFLAEGNPVVGQPGVFKGRAYTIKEVTDTHMVVEWKVEDKKDDKPAREPSPGPNPNQKADDKATDAAGMTLVKFVKRIGACKDVELLEIVRDEANMHTWTGPQLESINQAYAAKQSELTKGKSK